MAGPSSSKRSRAEPLDVALATVRRFHALPLPPSAEAASSTHVGPERPAVHNLPGDLRLCTRLCTRLCVLASQWLRALAWPLHNRTTKTANSQDFLGATIDRWHGASAVYLHPSPMLGSRVEGRAKVRLF